MSSYSHSIKIFSFYKQVLVKSDPYFGTLVLGVMYDLQFNSPLFPVTPNL